MTLEALLIILLFNMRIALTTTTNMFQVHNSFRFGNKEMQDDKKCEGSIETPKECVKSIQTWQ